MKKCVALITLIMFNLCVSSYGMNIVLNEESKPDCNYTSTVGFFLKKKTDNLTLNLNNNDYISVWCLNSELIMNLVNTEYSKLVDFLCEGLKNRKFDDIEDKKTQVLKMIFAFFEADYDIVKEGFDKSTNKDNYLSGLKKYLALQV